MDERFPSCKLSKIKLNVHYWKFLDLGKLSTYDEILGVRE